MKALTLCFKPHLSFSTLGLLPTKPPLSRFLQCLGINLASPKLVGNAAEQGGRPRSCGEHPVRRQHRPARATTSLYFYIALGKSLAVEGFFIFSYGPCSAETLAQSGNIDREAPSSKKVL